MPRVTAIVYTDSASPFVTVTVTVVTALLANATLPPFWITVSPFLITTVESPSLAATLIAADADVAVAV